jgi:hypothetical protein
MWATNFHGGYSDSKQYQIGGSIVMLKPADNSV